MGGLEFVDNTVDRSTGTIKLKGVFTNNERRLWPGQFINVALTLTTQPDAVIVPSEAVQVGPEGQHVFVVKPDKTVEVRPVILGSTSEGEAVIAKGLVPGEQIVREGQFMLGAGSRVEFKNPVNTVGGSKGEDSGARASKGGGAADDASAAVEMKGTGRGNSVTPDRAITAGAVKESAKGDGEADSKGVRRRGNRGQSKSES
jgi:multidrug efflux system membrane fusion protein